MAKIKKKVLLTFPQSLLDEPILFKMGQEFKVIPNIKGASVSDEIGLVVVVLEGEEEDITRSLDYLRGRHVKVEPMESSA